MHRSRSQLLQQTNKQTTPTQNKPLSAREADSTSLESAAGLQRRESLLDVTTGNPLLKLTRLSPWLFMFWRTFLDS